jgi:putative oxidoreductase
MTLVRLLARPMLSSMFVVGGINSLKNAKSLAPKAEPITDRVEPLLGKAVSSLPFKLPISLTTEQEVMLNGAVHVVGGAMLATGRAPRLSSFVLAATLIPTTLAGHRFWEETDPQLRSNQQIHFFKNVSMMGGLLLASVDTEGKPGLAWRAKRQARHAREVAAEQVHKLAPG